VPCEWQTFAHVPTRGELCEAFGLSSSLGCTDGAPDDSETLRQVVEQIADVKIRYAVELLSQRLEKLELAVSGANHTPDAVEVCLSLDGMEVDSGANVACGVNAGVHVVLEDNFHFLCATEVTRCKPLTEGYRVGMKFIAPDAASHRRWTRNLMRLTPRST
jgi:hypothetical protein